MKISPPPVGERAWSYSRYNVYRDCPYRWKLQYVDKLPTVQGPAASRGERIHKDAEMYVAEKTDVLAPELAAFADKFKAEREHPGVGVEEEWAFTKNLDPTSWFAKDCWLRIKVDLVLPLPKRIIRVTDYKTGRVKDRGEYDDQLELYALGAMLMFNDVDEVQTTIRYIDHGIEPERTFDYQKYPQLRSSWLNRVKKMQNDVEFKPTPGYACRFCDFASNKGGPCEFNSVGKK